MTGTYECPNLSVRIPRWLFRLRRCVEPFDTESERPAQSLLKSQVNPEHSVGLEKAGNP